MTDKSRLRIVIQSNTSVLEPRRYRDMLGMSVVIRLPDAMVTEQAAKRIKRVIEREGLQLEMDFAKAARHK